MCSLSVIVVLVWSVTVVSVVVGVVTVSDDAIEPDTVGVDVDICAVEVVLSCRLEYVSAGVVVGIVVAVCAVAD